MDPFIDPAFSECYRHAPLVLVDVGASGGLDRRWKSASKYLEVIAFEPDDRAFRYLASTDSIRCLNVGLHKEKTVLDFYLTRKQEVSSVLKPNRKFVNQFPESERFDILKTIRLEAETLDLELQKHQIKDLDFVKVDTQGSELFVLKGATKNLANSVFGMEIEVGFSRVYVDQPLFSDVDCFVRKLGFQLFDLKPIYWKRKVGKSFGKAKGQIICADCLYLKDMDALKAIIDPMEDNVLKKTKCLRAISICILYGYLDYAAEIFQEMKHLFNRDEASLFFGTIKEEIEISRRIPNFRGRGRIANVFYKLYELTQNSHGGWAISGRELGNL